MPDRMPMPDAVFVNAKFCVESPSRIRVPVEVLVKLILRGCARQNTKPVAVCVKGMSGQIHQTI